MHLEKWRVVFLGFLLMVALPLLGAGCKKESSAPLIPADSGQPVADANPLQDRGPVVPEGWQVYRSESHGFDLVYPGNWYYRERPAEDIGNANFFIVDFNDESAFPRETEALYLEAILTVYNGRLTDALGVPDGTRLVSEEVIESGNRQIHKQITRDNFDDLLPSVVTYAWQIGETVYELSGFADIGELRLMAQNFRSDGGE